ncbi:MAG: Holliday junction branch migration protein RuvA, partial [bacterium]
KQVKLLTYLHVREDTLQLYGFATQQEKWMFSNLIAVSGVGPKLALGILSGCAVEDLKRFIGNEEIEALTRLPGVGRKTAQRLVMELKDKLGEGTVATEVSPMLAGKAVQGQLEEAVLALVSLGFNKSHAQKVLLPIIKNEPALPLDEIIKRALQSI